MANFLDGKLVVGISSSALFDTREEHEIFQKLGKLAFVEHQIKNEEIPFKKGTAFSLIEGLLRLNPPQTREEQKIKDEQLVEVIVLSHNQPAAGLRAMNSIDKYGLNINRAAFVGDGALGPYLILQNPYNATAYDANSPHGNIIDFDRTPVFKIAKQCEYWDASYAMLALGIALRFINNLVISRLQLTEPELAAICGYSLRSADGFRDVLDPMRYRPAARALSELRKTALITHMSGYRGFEPKDYTLHFIPSEDSPAE